jgi:hypothetical protein
VIYRMTASSEARRERMPKRHPRISAAQRTNAPNKLFPKSRFDCSVESAVFLHKGLETVGFNVELVGYSENPGIFPAHFRVDV